MDFASAAAEAQALFLGCIAALTPVVYLLCNIELCFLFARMVQPMAIIL
jgi:hypothetical protein